MEWLATILTSGNALVILCFLTLFVVIGVVLLKKGILSFSSKNLQLGIQNKERQVLQRQTTYVHTQIDAIANRLIIEHPEFDKYHTNWICKCVEIEWIRAIHYNHIESTKSYIDDRFIQVRAIVQKKATNQYFFSKEFEDFLRQHIEATVEYLTKVRNEI